MPDLLKAPFLRELTPTQLQTLASIEIAPAFRVPSGWRRRGAGNRITLATGAALCRAGLATIAIVKGHSALVITREGKAFRNERRRA